MKIKNLISRRHKNNKLWYYIKGYWREVIPASWLRSSLPAKLMAGSGIDEEDVRKRVNYYNKLTTLTPLADATPSLGDYKLPKRLKVYYFDTYEYTRYFNPRLKANFLIGDITHVPPEPAITKSRPIAGVNQNSVLLKINKVRHFTFINDKIPFTQKKDMLVGRAVVRREHRIRFYEMYFNHPMCNLGQINKGSKTDQWVKNKLTIDEHLTYKFILCLEGNDVASNLKWVMSSNSLAVMPKPKYETWFMEGTLVPNHHYVLIKDDYSDLEERLTYYIRHPEEAQKIISNANHYVQQFKNTKQEDLISLLVLEKYFYKTGQLPYRQQAYYE